MADKNLSPTVASKTIDSQHSSDSKTIIDNAPEDKESLSTIHNFEKQLLQARADFNVMFHEQENDEELQHTSTFFLDSDPATQISIQRVSSEDEFKFCSKRKRAKFIGPYLFGDVIGQGSYAKVKECLDRRNLCRRAVKIMQQRRLRKMPYGEKMAATEIYLLKKLNHPNVIKLYDFIRNDEKQKLYLFIDLCVVSLQDMLDDDEQKQQIKAFPVWQAHGYFVQLIYGLEYLHSKFIIHNDIKPGNLLITVDHQLKITDFGTAEQLNMFSSDDRTKRSQGTPAFQCPEIANGEDTYNGFSIDVWSCGVTLYNLVTGHLPFEADNIYLLFQTIGRGIYQIPNELEPQLTGLIQGLLHVDTRLRFTLEQIKQHDWFRRRPPRTFEFLPFPRLALDRLHTFTMYDYLTDLHQSSILAETNYNNNHEEQMNTYDDLTSVSNSCHDNQYEEQQQQQIQNNPPTINYSYSQSANSQNIQQMKTRSKPELRICSLS